jgi:hypothetical protein
LGS